MSERLKDILEAIVTALLFVVFGSIIACGSLYFALALTQSIFFRKGD